MAANTITGQEILFKIARDVGETQSAFVRTVTSQTVVVLGGVSLGEHEPFKHALATTLGGGIRKVSAYVEATETITLSSAFDVTIAAGDVVELAWWNPRYRALAMQAINEAIRSSWSVWSRETIVDRSSASITLASGTHSYALPSAVGQLVRIGIQPQATDPIEWFEPFQGGWNVEGQEGAYTLRFEPGYGGYVVPAWSSRVRIAGAGGTFADAFSGQLLCLHYAAREGEISTETGTTQLPLDYFTKASALYLQSKLGLIRDGDEMTRINALLPLLQQQAEEANARLARTKGRPVQVARLQY